jgi:hypothetical protein
MHHIARKTEYPAGNAVITEGQSPFSAANTLLKKKLVACSRLNSAG